MKWLFPIIAMTACTADVDSVSGDGDDDGDFVDTSQQFDAHGSVSGANGNVCKASKYNCHVRDGGQRVTTPGKAGTDQKWAVSGGDSVYDGEGTPLAAQPAGSLVFNYGMLKTINGRQMALAMATANGSAGWIPTDHIVDRTTFLANDKAVDAKSPGTAHMSCYKVRDSDDKSLELKKVVYNSKEDPITGHERAGDYLSLVRANNKRSANMAYAVPGFSLGGGTDDHILAGTHFQRVDVPTDAGPPSISIPLWVQDSNGDFKKQSGTMRFIYGFIRTNGVARWGWMSMDALEVSSTCP